jgi:sterol desaturase/sphingolipid hydroxylase (fatty acid hydroxylase superfamily)
MEPSTEMIIRMASFAAIFAVMATWEFLSPCRALLAGRRPRWPNNLGILVLDALAVRLVIPTAAVGVAIMAAERGWGLLNLVAMPSWLAGLAGFLILDFAIYAQHYFFHHVPWLWRLHRMHHADLDIDLTTGVRFHPVEILISLAIKIAVVLTFGIPALAVLIFEIILNATSVFNHANVAMPAWLDRIMRLIVVTPDMHRVHHSVDRSETDSNFGFNLPWWDRLFGTYRAQPAAGHQRMTIGLPVFRDLRELRIDRLLTQPFRNGEHETRQPDGGPPSHRN